MTNTTAQLFPEYGARIALTNMWAWPDGTRGTIVGFSDDGTDYLVTLDNYPDTIPLLFAEGEFDITQTPSDSAYRLTCKWSVDETLKALVDVADIIIDQRNTTYTSALVFELYRLNYYAEAQAQEWTSYVG